ncbi:MAG: hypothetical protein KF816_17190 [Melioribacteraceae bacterium]|nr:hypothetical protein [Melioribacteraceae bacterium]
MKLNRIKIFFNLVLLLFTSTYMNNYAQTAAQLSQKGIENKNNNKELALSYFEQAFKLDPSEFTFLLEIIRQYHHSYLTTDSNSVKKLSKMFESSLNSLNKNKPLFDLYFEVGQLFYFYSMFVPQIFNDINNPTKEELKKWKTVSANCDSYEKYGYAYLLNALEICPKDSIYNKSKIYYFFAQHYKKLSQSEENKAKVINFYELAFDTPKHLKKPPFLNNYYELADYLYTIGDLEKAKKTIEIARDYLTEFNKSKTEEVSEKINYAYEMNLIIKNNPKWNIIENEEGENLTTLQGFVFLFHPSSMLVHSDGLIRVWIKQIIFPINKSRQEIISEIFPEKEEYSNYQESRWLIELNIKMHTYNYIEIIHYNLLGSVINSFNYNDSPKNIPPDTNIESIANYFAKKYK